VGSISNIPTGAWKAGSIRRLSRTRGSAALTRTLAPALRAVAPLLLGAATLALSAAPSSAFEHVLRLAMDTDNLTATGCDWSLEEVSGTSLASGVEHLVVVSVDASTSPPQVSRVTLQDCLNSVFGVASEVSPGNWPVGLGTGGSGTDVVEFALPTSLLGASPNLRLYAGAQSAAGGRDALTTTDGTPSGSSILFAPAAEVPGLGWIASLVAAAALLALGVALLQSPRARTLCGLGLALVALRSASALLLGLDGQVGEWAGTAPAALDASGDSTGADLHSDLRGLFVALDGDTLAVRIDVASLEVLVCGPGDSPGAPPCDGLCGFADDAAGPDCDGVCDAGEAPAGPDCAPNSNSPPSVFITVDGGELVDPLETVSGTTLQFSAEATDPDGLGFPLPAFGNAVISYHWTLDGAEVPGSLWVFHPSPPITFRLDPGEIGPRTFRIELTVYDSLGASTTGGFDVNVIQQPPEVTLRANGELVGDVLNVPVGGTVQFETEASDADGLGFAHPGLGGQIVSYLWSIDGAQAANSLSVFSPDPEITFGLGPGQSPPHSFELMLSVYDTLGNVTERSFTVDALGPACDCANGMIWSDASGPCLEQAAIVDKLSEPTPSKVTWRFAESAACWKFADGTFGVEAGVTLTAIEPHHTAACENWVGLTDCTGAPPGCEETVPEGEECLNGYMINPDEVGVHSLDNRTSGKAYGFVEIPAALRLPYSPPKDTSILKVQSRLPDEECRQCVQYLSVLTVLEEAPAELSFRPPMTHAYKPLIPAAMDLSLLPNLPVLQSMPGDDEVFNFVQHTSSGWNVEWYMSNLVPWDARGDSEFIPGYAPNMEFLRSQAFLYLVTNVGPEDKQRVAVHLVQEGIDHFGALRGGFAWTSDAGIRNGRYLPIVFAAALLGSQEIADVLSAADLKTFSEWDHMAPAEGNPPASVDLAHWPELPVILFGRESHTAELEGPYWDCYACFVAGTCGPPQELFPTGTNCSGKDLKDPYRRIDGGRHPGSDYMAGVWGPYKYTALMHWLVPALRPFWGPQRPEDAGARDWLLRYVDRLEEVGTWTEPDSCAPVGAPEDYQIGWGPAPQNPGACIQGGGRSPELHGYDINLSWGTRINDFGQAMWEAYRNCAQDCSCPGMEGLCGAP